MGKKGTPYRKWSKEEKLQYIRLYLEEHIPRGSFTATQIPRSSPWRRSAPAPVSQILQICCGEIVFQVVAGKICVDGGIDLGRNGPLHLIRFGAENFLLFFTHKNYLIHELPAEGGLNYAVPSFPACLV